MAIATGGVALLIMLMTALLPPWTAVHCQRQQDSLFFEASSSLRNFVRGVRLDLVWIQVDDKKGPSQSCIRDEV